MKYNLFLSTVVAQEASQAASQVAPSNDIIGIGNIIITLLVGVLTCLVTWKTAMKSIKQKKFSYSQQVFPILSNSVTQKSELNFDDFEIKYKDKLLQNPCLLTIEIVNSGNEAIERPPIKIRNDENIEIIPGYFDDVPNGYEELWALKKHSQYACKIELEHVNPKQVVKARFFLENLPKEKIIFECPMPDIQVQEVSYIETNDSRHNALSYSRANLVLIMITVLLFASVDSWSFYISEFLWQMGVHVPAACMALFVMSTLLLVILLNAYGIPKVDNYMRSNAKISAFTKLLLIIVNIILLVMITFNIVIKEFMVQAVVAVFVIIMLALLIHFCLVTKET